MEIWLLNSLNFFLALSEIDDRVEFSEASGIPYDPSTIIPHDLEGGSTSVPSSCDARSDSDSDPAEDRAQVEVIRSTMSYKKMSPTKEPWRNGHRKTALCIRFRSTLTKRGVQMRYSGYRVKSINSFKTAQIERIFQLWTTSAKLSGIRDLWRLMTI